MPEEEISFVEEVAAGLRMAAGRKPEFYKGKPKHNVHSDKYEPTPPAAIGPRTPKTLDT